MPLASELIERLADPWARRELGRLLDELAGRGRVVERGVWLPAWTSLTVVGALTTTGRYTRLAHLVVVHVEVQGATSTASAVGTTYVNNLPFTLLRRLHDPLSSRPSTAASDFDWNSRMRAFTAV